MIKGFKNKKFEWLSNFYPVEIDGFASVEHFYQSFKSSDSEWKAFCKTSHNTARQVKQRGRQIRIRHDWEVIKLKVMKTAIRLKFSQDPFKTLLLNTESEYIREDNTWGDTFWGFNPITGVGDNHLGKLIMQYRDLLRIKDSKTN